MSIPLILRVHIGFNFSSWRRTVFLEVPKPVSLPFHLKPNASPFQSPALPSNPISFAPSPPRPSHVHFNSARFSFPPLGLNSCLLYHSDII
ncbi:hypothetical protein P170DRAFT_248598 [Aspergillus steynii IBT 23096]|uniref:Uncharacterized protein n=1 Tax=Aspergillus steynii IBT 23096 TaxID=1392250 RepID=A0A2I2FYM3_9EURO|nr:uncharacterized protein P170DRAFT_248598 [Aspergillus steynii IBT 23096]PLB45656.1 hypothetical protein P170DRAFT_248598 [Aspergillus steynii IBT 23096]